MNSTSPSGFHEVSHGADAALQVHATDLPGLFQQAALGMYDLMGLEPCGPGRSQRCLEIQAVDEEARLVCFLTNLLYLLEQEGLAATNMELVFGLNRLNATLDCCKAADIQREIKAVTFNELTIRRGERGFETLIVFDI